MPRTVLIVDDHAGFRRRARRTLEADGYQVVGEAPDRLVRRVHAIVHRGRCAVPGGPGVHQAQGVGHGRLDHVGGVAVVGVRSTEPLVTTPPVTVVILAARRRPHPPGRVGR